MAQSNTEFLQLLRDRNVDGLVRAWQRLFPAMPAPENREQAEIVMHHARTQTTSLSLRHRAYSHQWLTERGLPSGLPDMMRPSAQKLYPVKSVAVGISVGFSNPLLKPAADSIRKVMEDVVLEAHEDGKLKADDDGHVKTRMVEARHKEEKALFGNLAKPGQHGGLDNEFSTS